MTDVFLKILGMSATACIIIAVVLLLRLALKKAPKIFSYILWAAVFFRLLCPFAFELYSPVGVTPVEIQTQTQNTETVLPAVTEAMPAMPDDPPADVHTENAGNYGYYGYAGNEGYYGSFGNTGMTGYYEDVAPVYYPENAAPALPEEPVNAAVPETPAQPVIGEREGNSITIYTAQDGGVPAYMFMDRLIGALSAVWLFGTAGMALYGIISYLRLKGQLKTAREEDGAFISDRIKNPFILGVFRPKIYLPEGLDENQREFILLHEKAHIRRLDHIVKIVMYIALCLHWFNPLVWLSFRLCEKDMEMSADQRVTADMPSQRKADYSQTLLNVTAAKTAAFTACFGESSVKQRVKNVLYYKKPALWIIIVCIVGIAAAMVLMMTNRATAEKPTFYQRYFTGSGSSDAVSPPCLLYGGEYYATLLSSADDLSIADADAIKEGAEYIGTSIPVPDHDAQPMNEQEMTKCKNTYELYRIDENTVLAVGREENLLLVKLELPEEEQKEIRSEYRRKYHEKNSENDAEKDSGDDAEKETPENVPAAVHQSFSEMAVSVINESETLGEINSRLRELDTEGIFAAADVYDGTYSGENTYKGDDDIAIKNRSIVRVRYNDGSYISTSVCKKTQPMELSLLHEKNSVKVRLNSYEWSYLTTDGEWEETEGLGLHPLEKADYDVLHIRYYNYEDPSDAVPQNVSLIFFGEDPTKITAERWSADDIGNADAQSTKINAGKTDRGIFTVPADTGDNIYRITAKWDSDRFKGTVQYVFRVINGEKIHWLGEDYTDPSIKIDGNIYEVYTMSESDYLLETEDGYVCIFGGKAPPYGSLLDEKNYIGLTNHVDEGEIANDLDTNFRSGLKVYYDGEHFLLLEDMDEDVEKIVRTNLIACHPLELGNEIPFTEEELEERLDDIKIVYFIQYPWELNDAEFFGIDWLKDKENAEEPPEEAEPEEQPEETDGEEPETDENEEGGEDAEKQPPRGGGLISHELDTSREYTDKLPENISRLCRSFLTELWNCSISGGDVDMSRYTSSRNSQETRKFLEDTIPYAIPEGDSVKDIWFADDTLSFIRVDGNIWIKTAYFIIFEKGKSYESHIAAFFIVTEENGLAELLYEYDGWNNGVMYCEKGLDDTASYFDISSIGPFSKQAPLDKLLEQVPEDEAFEKAIIDIINNSRTMGEAVNAIKRMDKENRFYDMRDSKQSSGFTAGADQIIYDRMTVIVYLDEGKRSFSTTVNRIYEPPVLIVCGQGSTINAQTCSYDWRYRSEGIAGYGHAYDEEAPHPLDISDFSKITMDCTYDLGDEEYPELMYFGFAPNEMQPDEIAIECWNTYELGNTGAASKKLAPPKPHSNGLGIRYEFELEKGDYIYQITASWNEENHIGTVSYAFRVNLRGVEIRWLGSTAHPINYPAATGFEPERPEGSHSFFYHGYEYVTEPEWQFAALDNGKYYTVDKRYVSGEIQPEGGALDFGRLPVNELLTKVSDSQTFLLNMEIVDKIDPSKLLHAQSTDEQLRYMRVYTSYSGGYEGYYMLLIGTSPYCTIGGEKVYAWTGVPYSYYQQLCKAVTDTQEVPENITPSGNPIIPTVRSADEYTSFELPPSITAVYNGERVTAALNGYSWQYKSGDKWITSEQKVSDPMSEDFVKGVKTLHLPQPHARLQVIAGAPTASVTDIVVCRNMDPEMYGAYEHNITSSGGTCNSRYGWIIFLEKGRYMMQITTSWETENYKGTATYNFIVECGDYPDELSRQRQAFLSYPRVLYDDDDYAASVIWNYFTETDGVYYRLNMDISEKDGPPADLSGVTLVRDDIIADIFSYRSAGHTVYAENLTGNFETNDKSLAGMRVYLFKCGYMAYDERFSMVLRDEQPQFYIGSMPVYRMITMGRD